MKRVVEMYAIDGIYLPEKDQTGEIINRHKISDEAADCIRKKLKVLNIGCGNSPLSSDMYNDNYHDITNNDINP